MGGVQWNGFLHQSSTRIPYSEIREISWEKSGIASMIFDIGDCTIGMTTGGKVTLTSVHHPKQAELRILALRDEIQRAARLRDADAIQELLSDIVADHMAEQGFDY